MKHLEHLIKNNVLIQKIYIVLGSLFFRFISIFIKVKPNAILFSSMSGNNFEYSSPYFIYQGIKDKFGDKYEYIWAFKKGKMAPAFHGKSVRIDTFTYFITALRAGIWITDVNIERGLRLKRKGQYYVNTWHGSVIKSYPKNRKDYDLKNVDIFCSDGAYYDAFFTKHYHVNPKALLHCGRPREDSIFVCEDNRKQIREELGLKDTDYVALYMPTWRENGTVPPLDVEYLFQNVPYLKLIFHAHNLDETKQKFPTQILNLSAEKNLNKLYATADLLISDYSSCIYDFLLLHKPVVLLAKDYDEYRAERGLEIDFKKEFPNSVATTEQDLVKLIESLRKNPQEREFQLFLDKIVDVQDRKKLATTAIIEKMETDGVLG